MKDRILIALPNDHLGGAEQYLKMISECFYQRGFEVHVYFLAKRKTGAFDSNKSKRYKLLFTKYSKERFGILGMISNLKLNKHIKYKYVFTSHAGLNSFISMMRKWKVLKAEYHIARESTSVFTRFSGIKLLIYKLSYKLSYKRVDLLICQTDFMYNQLMEGIPSVFKSINVQVIPNPVNLCSFNNENYNNVPFSNYIVSAGRLIKEKGFDILIESFKKLLDSHPSLKLVILGEGERRDDLERQINHLGLVGKVFLPGFIKNVYPYFKHADLCVVSSRIEGFPNVLLQMMSQNTKVVSTLCAGGIEALKGVSTCMTGDVNSLHDTIFETLENDTSNNREIFDKELKERSIENFIKKIEKYIYQ